MRQRLLSAVIVCLAPWSSAWCAAPLPPSPVHRSPADKFQTWRTTAAERLAARADAGSLATAAALLFAGSSIKPGADSAALDLVVRASDLAPENAAIAWLRMQLCATAPDCDFRDAATAMRWIAADNAAAWMPTLTLAQRDRDTTEVDRILADMALGRRFDIYWNRINLMMIDALKSVAGGIRDDLYGSDAGRLSVSRGIATAEVVPPYHPLVDACRESAAGTERRESCLKLSKTMQQGDVISTQMIGLAIERRFLAPDSREARALDERRRVLDYRLMAGARFGEPLLPWLRNRRARWRIARMRNLHREEDVCVAVLREQGLPLEPPEADSTYQRPATQQRR
jgi:hypothetical protein